MPTDTGVIDAPNIKTSKTASAVRLAKACLASDEKLKAYRLHNLNLLRQYCGPYYSTYAPTEQAKREPVNTLYAIVSILLPNLCGTTVKSRVKVKGRPELGVFASLYQLAADHMLDQMEYGLTQLRIVSSALFGTGIAKTILETKPLDQSPDFPNWLQDAGWPYVGQVGIDDYVLDPAAMCREAAAFEGNDFLIPIDLARDAGYDKDILDRMSATYYNEAHQDKSSGLSAGSVVDNEEFIEFYKFREIYLPYEKMVVTLPYNKTDETNYLKEMEYKGPEGGPYDDLSFARPENNPLGIPPVSIFYDLHLVLNALTRKIQRQAQRSKKILVYQRGKEEDGTTIRDSSDGDVIGLTDTQMTKELEVGGADSKNYESLNVLRDLLNWVSGNPDSVGGLAAGEKTLGQDEMKLTQASARLGRMQALVQKFNKRVLRKTCWYLWTDPQTRMDLLQPIGEGMQISRTWSPEVREGEFPDYDIDVEPYVASADNPLDQYRRIMQLITNVIIPMAPMAQAQGVEVDIGKLVKDLASKLDIETEWFKQGTPMLGPTTGMSPGAGMGEPSMVGTRGPQPQQAPKPGRTMTEVARGMNNG